MATSGSILGNPVRRREDRAFSPARRSTSTISGRRAAPRRVRPVDDRPRRDRGVDTSDAAAMPGVVAVYTADDLDLPDHHGFMMLPPTMNRPPLATTRCASSATSSPWSSPRRRRQAVDAAEAVIVDYDPLPADRRHGGRARRRRAGLSRGARLERRQRDGHRRRSKVCSTTPTWSSPARIVNQRVAPVPMEPHGIVVRAGRSPTGGSTFYGRDAEARTACATSSPRCSASTPTQVHGRHAAVGGGFGAKAGLYRRAPHRRRRPRCCSAARSKWTETRSENMVAMAHGRGQVQYVELGLQARRHDHRAARAHSSATPAPTRASARSCRASRA